MLQAKKPAANWKKADAPSETIGAASAAALAALATRTAVCKLLGYEVGLAAYPQFGQLLFVDSVLFLGFALVEYLTGMF